MTTVRGVKDRRFKFVQLLNCMFEDQKLSLKSKGFIGYCLTKTEDWKFNMTHLCATLKEGERAIYSTIDECEEQGYAFRWQPHKEDGDFDKWETVISDSKVEIALLKEELKDNPYFKKSFTDRRFADAQVARAQSAPISNIDTIAIRKQQQQPSSEELNEWDGPFAAAAVFSVPEKEEQERQSYAKNVQPERCRWHSVLDKVDIPEADKVEITQRYSEDIVKNAIEWAQATKHKIKTTYVAYLKMACQKGLSVQNLPPPTLTPYEELKLNFKNYEEYNGATCYFTDEYIAFERGNNNRKVDLNEYFTWQKFQNLCDSFGIEFNREKKK